MRKAVFVVMLFLVACQPESIHIYPDGTTSRGVETHTENENNYVSTTLRDDLSSPTVEVVKINSGYRLIDNEMGVVCYFLSRSGDAISCIPIPDNTGR